MNPQRSDFKVLTPEEAASALTGIANSDWRVESIHPKGRDEIEKILHEVKTCSFDPATMLLGIMVVANPSRGGMFKDSTAVFQKTVKEMRQIDARSIAIEFDSLSSQLKRDAERGIGYLQPGGLLVLTLPWKKVPIDAKIDAESYSIKIEPLESGQFQVSISARPKWNIFDIDHIPILYDKVPTRSEIVELIGAALKTPLADYAVRFDLSAPKGSGAYYGQHFGDDR